MRSTVLYFAFFVSLILVGCGKKSETAEADPMQAVFDATQGAIERNPSTSQNVTTEAPVSYAPTVVEEEWKTPRLTVDQILSNPELIDRKYSLREIEISGVLKKHGPDDSAGGVNTVWLRSAMNQGENSIACRLRDASSGAKLAQGGSVVMRGRLARDMAQSLEDCEVVAEH